jgi:hypothetical protein
MYRKFSFMAGLIALATFVPFANAAEDIGSSPSIALRAGDPANFEVTPSVEQTGMIAEGNPVRLIFGNSSEGLRVRASDLLPSSWVGDYTLAVQATDGGDQATSTVTFNYAPQIKRATSTKNGILWVPSSQTALRNNTGNFALNTDPFTDELPAPYSGSFMLKAAVKAGSDVGLRVNGIAIRPGDMPVSLGAYNFAATGGKLDLPVSAVSETDAGKGMLLITVDRPNSPVVEVEYKVWKPVFALESDKTTAIQAADRIRFSATANPSNFCTLATSLNEAMTTNVFSEPKCILEWKINGDVVTARTDQTSIESRIYQTGPANIELSSYVINSDGSKIRVAMATTGVEITPASDSIRFTVDEAINEPIQRIVQEVRLEAYQTEGPRCTLYNSVDAAKAAASTTMACIGEWTGLPEGITELPNSYRPTIGGFVSAPPADYEIGLVIYLVDPKGQKMEVDRSAYMMKVIEPAVPNVVFTPTIDKIGDALALPADTSTLGYFEAKNVLANLTLSAKLSDATKFFSSDIKLSGGRAISATRSTVPAPSLPVGKVEVMTFEGVYPDLPDLTFTDYQTVISLPGKYVLPVVTFATEEETGLNTASVSLNIDIADRDTPYNSATMGNWEVRLLERENMRDRKPISDWMPIDATGHAVGEIDLSGYEAGSLRVVAEARLILDTPISEEIIRESSRPLSIDILNGTEIAGTVAARTIAGPAPFSTMFDFRIDDRNDRRALGDVTFEVSDDFGATWQEPEEQNGSTRLRKTFEEGTYWVRARSINANSGAEYVSEIVEVFAFRRLDIAVSGGDIAFAGEYVENELTITSEGELLSREDVILEKSTDRKKTWETVTDLTETLTSAEPDTITTYYRARHIDAPDDNRYAWNEASKRVVFREIRAPRVSIYGPSRLELGSAYEFRASTSMPFAGFDDRPVSGEWTMPDGTKAYGETITYIPGEADLEARKLEITYTAWLDEYPEVTDNDVSRLFLWKYEWPTWNFAIKRQTYYPPARVTIRAKTVGTTPNLEEPKYEWTLPEGAVVESDTREEMRVLEVQEAGTFPISLTVSDARGNRETIEGTFELLPVPPIETELRLRPGNIHYRAPLEVTARTVMRGGHPHDRPMLFTYFVNGIQVAEASDYRAKFDLPAGQHEVMVRVTTEFGQVVDKTESITVNPNKVPVCELTGEEVNDSFRYRADCRDEDGKILDYQWTVDGSLYPNSSAYRLTVPRGERDFPPLVSMIAIDDSGEGSAPVFLGP